MGSEGFWDRVYTGNAGAGVASPVAGGWIFRTALDHFGDVNGKTVLDLGFGNGVASVFFAERGARVIAIDTSSVAVRKLRRRCEKEGLNNVEVHECGAMDLAQFGSVHFVFGAMILHHIEPFDQFVTLLRQSMCDGGKGFFYENSAKSQLLMWARRSLVGKLWIPKYGDPDEYPLTAQEVAELRDQFPVRVEYPYLHLFRMVPGYLLKGRFQRPFAALDDFLFRFPGLRHLSYRQALYLG